MSSLKLAELLISLLLGVSVIQQGMGEKASQPHKATLEDKAGPYSLGNNLSLAQTNRLLSKIRGFLWDHWSEDRPGQLQATVYTVEGDPTTYIFFVEKDSKGHWCIRAKSESVVAKIPEPGETRSHEMKEVTYYEIERLDSESNKPIPREEKRQPDKYRLQLKGETGPKNFVW